MQTRRRQARGKTDRGPFIKENNTLQKNMIYHCYSGSARASLPLCLVTSLIRKYASSYSIRKSYEQLIMINDALKNMSPINDEVTKATMIVK